VPHSQTYRLTALGVRVAHFFTKVYTHLFRPGLAALVPAQPLPSPLAQALATVSTQIQALVAEAQLGQPATT
jgi:hypothetical protein